LHFPAQPTIENGFQPAGLQKVAGGRSGAETAGGQPVPPEHPEGMPEICDLSGVGGRSLERRAGGVAPACATLRRGKSFDPRLLSAKLQLANLKIDEEP
jgi:hypothetical protein